MAAEAAMMAGAAGARILGALIGRALAEGDYQAAERLQRQALEQYGTIDPNTLLEVDVQQQDAELGKYVEDPEAQQAQMLALRRMGEMATGDSPEDAAAYARSQQESGGFERGIREAALRRMQERGIGQNSGLAVAAQMGAAQQSVQNKSNADLETAAEARRRALAALGQYGNMATGIRGQNFGQARDRAAAQDTINRFNAGQRFDQAQGTFNNQMGLAGAKAGRYGDLANMNRRKGDMTQQTFAGTGDAIGDSLDAYGKKKKDE